MPSRGPGSAPSVAHQPRWSGACSGLGPGLCLEAHSSAAAEAKRAAAQGSRERGAAYGPDRALGSDRQSLRARHAHEHGMRHRIRRCAIMPAATGWRSARHGPPLPNAAAPVACAGGHLIGAAIGSLLATTKEGPSPKARPFLSRCLPRLYGLRVVARDRDRRRTEAVERQRIAEARERDRRPSDLRCPVRVRAGCLCLKLRLRRRVHCERGYRQLT